MAEKMQPKKILCKYCIEAIRSHGEKVYVGETIDNEDGKLKCDWCEESDPELYECI